MKITTKLLLSGAALGLLASAPASAATIVGLYNTGVDSTGAVLTGNNAVDTHYTVAGASTFTTSNPAYITSPTAGYIASGLNGSGGSAVYTLTFNLGDLNPLTASLSGKTAYDNGVQIFLNGNLIYTDTPAAPGTYDAFQALHNFSADSSLFVAGQNTLTFNVTDYGSPSGLLVTDLTGVAAVPEPATWGLMLVGFGMVGAGARYRKRATKVTYA